VAGAKAGVPGEIESPDGRCQGRRGSVRGISAKFVTSYQTRIEA
jgi:hypothetical protein